MSRLFVAWVQLSPRFVLLCQHALTSARHNCAQLSRKVAAMWHALKGIWGLETREKKIQFGRHHTIRSYLFSCPSGKQACHLRFCTASTSWIIKEHCLTNCASLLQYVFHSPTTNKMSIYSAALFMLFPSKVAKHRDHCVFTDSKHLTCNCNDVKH